MRNSFAVVTQVANQLDLRNAAALVTVHQCPHSFEVCRRLRRERVLDKGQALGLAKSIATVHIISGPDLVDK